MYLVKVKAAPGRAVPRAPRGAFVSDAEFVTLPATEWVRERIACGDLVLEKPVAPAPSAPAPVAPPRPAVTATKSEG